MTIDRPAIREMAAILKERGVPYQTSRIWTEHTCLHTRKMVDWLKENPEAGMKEIVVKVKELGRLQAT